MTKRYADKKIVVVGAGKSGLALCRFFARRQARVVLSDLRQRNEINGLETLSEFAIEYDLGGHNTELFRSADLVVLSPGVPSDIPPAEAALNAGVEVSGEVEIAALEMSAPMIGITGTNGKSTVTALVGEAFQAVGCSTYIGGNIGTPLTEAVDKKGWDWLIIELSSFQLETIRQFRPRYSMLLNISADHLDRYPDMQAYVDAKKRIFINQATDDFMVLNADDAAVIAAADGVPARPVWFSCRRELDQGMFLAGNTIVWRWSGDEKKFPANDLKLKGLHNIANVMAAMIPPLLEKCNAESVWQAMTRFSGLPHRMNLVRSLDGVDWYNDSKGTNVGSVVMSLAGLKAPVTLIAGGKDKGGDFGELREPVSEKVDHLILIGEAAGRMASEIGPVADISRVASLGEAVLRARELTRPGGTVLLSPGCSSFDQFANFAARGERFCELVEQLDAGKAVSNGTP